MDQEQAADVADRDKTIRNVSSKSAFGATSDNTLNIFIMISIILAFTFMIVLLNKKQ